MLRLKLRLFPVIVSLSVFVVFVTVLPLAGQSDPPLPSSTAPTPADRIFLPLVTNAELNANDEYPPSRIDAVNAAAHTGNSGEDPPAASRHTFATDSGWHLDRTLFRGDLLTQ